MKTTKRITFAMASSSFAVKSGFPAGAYVVERISYNPTMQPGKLVKGFATLADAQSFADTLPEPLDRFSEPSDCDCLDFSPAADEILVHGQLSAAY